MATILNLFNEAKSEKKLHEGVGASTPHKDLHAQGWKKSHMVMNQHAGYVNVYKHPHHTGHEIHVHPDGHFEHKVGYGPEHIQKGKAAKGMSPLAKHLDAHSRTTGYDEHTRAEHRRKQPGGDWT